MLETACSNIASWPDPTPGNALELGFLGSVMQVEIPRSENEHQSIATSSFGEKFNMKIHIPLAGDFRPYFHIHDQDYAILVNKNPPKAGLILGVTNPFFGNLCKHWPHILSVGRAGDAAKTTTQPRSTPFMGPEPGFHTQHKRFISKDRALLKKLEDAVQKGGAAEIEACTLLRQHFTDRTTKLLVPLNRHFQSLIPIDPKAPLKPKQREFYERWLRTPAFGVWLTQRVGEVQEVLQRRAAGGSS
ncbi:hypothetical protein FRC05_002460 [Tulasnella sp. 425]|nr:hypothetical protein FRC05_002460 [Tulasnella sp. 425]